MLLLLPGILAGSRSSLSVSFAVFSDPHLYDTSLGASGSAWEAYLAHDSKLLAESEAILRSAVDAIKLEAPDFLLVSGDLTKDGEKVSHELFATYLAELTSAGVKVFVVPGNHDVANPHAHGYDGAATVDVDSVTPEEFAAIYGPYGYDQAFSRDTASLSYAAKINSKLWILGLDACRYEENDVDPVTGGRLKEATLDWAESVLHQANAAGARVLAMMHHGAMEHYAGQSTGAIGVDFVVADHAAVGLRLAEAGLRTIFTGHFHAQDIASAPLTLADGSTAMLTDIETGSLATYPNAYRLATLSSDGVLTIRSRYVTDIDPAMAPASGWNPETESFTDYAKRFLEDGLALLAMGILQLFGMTGEQASAIAPSMVAAFEAHYMGNEQITPEADAFIQNLEAAGDTASLKLAGLLRSLWTDAGEDDLTRDASFDPQALATAR